MANITAKNQEVTFTVELSKREFATVASALCSSRGTIETNAKDMKIDHLILDFTDEMKLYDQFGKIVKDELGGEA